jgi:hypothetical protein
MGRTGGLIYRIIFEIVENILVCKREEIKGLLYILNDKINLIEGGAIT